MYDHAERPGGALGGSVPGRPLPYWLTESVEDSDRMYDLGSGTSHSPTILTYPRFDLFEKLQVCISLLTHVVEYVRMA